jgi:hypothetical protein
MWYWELLAILLLTNKINQTSKLVKADEADLAASSYEAEGAGSASISLNET